MVTAETALVLPVLVLVLAAAVSALLVVGAQVRCVDAAREGARAAARGEPPATVSRMVAEVAPAAAVSTVSTGPGGAGAAATVVVTVTAPVRALGPLPWRLWVSARATALIESGSAGAAP